MAIISKKIFIFILIFALTAVAVGAFALLKNKPGIFFVPVIESLQTISSDERLKEEIGQMIMVGFRDAETTKDSDISKTIQKTKIGGVMLFDYDAPAGSFPRNIINKEQTKKLISDLQNQSATPLFIAIDAEGGNVNRLKPAYGFFPIISAEEMGKDKTFKTTQDQSLKLAKELKELGINMNFAPVVDLNINPKNPIIGKLGRSFSSSEKEVINNAEIFIKNHKDNNIITVEKHFPGQGSATEDTHLGLADVTNTYKEEELVPYKELNKKGLLDVVMVAHVINKKIDDKYPASLSYEFLQNILRNQIGFKGVIISDDLQMDAIQDNYNLKDAVVLAINAGCDIVTFSNNSKSGGYDKELAQKVSDIIFTAVKEKKIDEKKITESYERIISLKKNIQERAKAEALEIRNKKFELLAVQKDLTFGEIFDIVKYVEKKTGVRSALLLAVSQEELVLEKADLCHLTNAKTGEGVRIMDGKKIAKVMNPERDIDDFIKINQELNRDPLKSVVTCPMSFGWGGAMGPADFIASTWMKYKDKIEQIIQKKADPWNISDAFLGMGLYLSDSGANLKTRDGEWKSSMVYFSGSADSGYNFYADQVMLLTDKFQKDVETIERSY